MYKVTDKLVSAEGREYIVYGIYYNEEYHIDDISADGDAIKRLADDCNKFSLDPIHLADVAEDFLS